MFKSILLAVFALTLSTIVSGEPTKKKDDGSPRPKIEIPPGDLSGYYTCKGEEAGGKKYAGIVVLTKKADVYVISWVIGGNNFSGIGIRQGDDLACSWAIPNQQGQIVRGVNLYRVYGGKDGPRLTGRWASVPGPGLQQTETLTFLKKLDPEE